MNPSAPSLRLATRGSALARRQCEIAALALQGAGVRTETVIVTTTGDRDRTSPLTEIGGRGVFVREIEEALRSGEADVAVHSLKDQPTDESPGLVIAAILEREDPADVVVAASAQGLLSLPAGARVGTSSTRRIALLRRLRPDLEIVPLRGNVDTRLRRTHEGELDAVVLAGAGMNRLGRGEEVTERLDPRQFVPAPGQGAIALQCRSDDAAVTELLARLDDERARAAVTAERGFLAAFGGGCAVPVGAYAEVGTGLALRAIALHPSLDGTGWDIAVAGSPADAAELGRRAADDVLARSGDLLRP